MAKKPTKGVPPPPTGFTEEGDQYVRPGVPSSGELPTVDLGPPPASAAPPPPPAGFEAAPVDAPTAPATAPDGSMIVDVVGGTTDATITPTYGADPAKISSDLKSLFEGRASKEEIKNYILGSGSPLPASFDEMMKNYETDRQDASKKVPDWSSLFKVQPQAPQTGAIDSVTGGGRSALTLGLDDELEGMKAVKRQLAKQAFGDTAGGAIDSTSNFLAGANPLGMIMNMIPTNDVPTNSDVRRTYEATRARRDELKSAQWDQHPWAYGTGFAAGTVPTLFAGGGGAVDAVRGTNAMARVTAAGKVVGTGAAYGGVSGAANAAPGDRLAGGAEGAIIGAALSPLGVLASRAISRGATGVKSMVGTLADRVGARRNNLNSGLDVLASRAPQTAGEMQAEAARYRAAGVDPTLTDVVDESGRGVIGAAANRPTPGREAAVRFARGRAEDTQDVVAGIARRSLGDDPVSARALADNATEARTLQDNPAFTAVRGDPVPLADLKPTLATDEGQSAIRAAIKLERDPAVRKQYMEIAKWARASNEVKVPPELQGLSPEARAQAMKQLGLGSAEPPPFTVGMADKISREMRDAAERAGRKGATGRAGVLRDFTNEIRDTARKASGGYATALEDSAAVAKAADAAAGRGRFNDNSDFLNTEPEVFNGRVTTASRTQPYLAGENRTIPSEFEGVQRRARDAVVNKANNGITEAVGVARKFAFNRNQAQRSTALLGEEGAGTLRNHMNVALDQFERAQTINPRAGSKTALTAGDNASLSDGVLETGLGAVTGGKWTLVQGIRKIFRMGGIRNVDAERLVRDAINPARTDSAIEYLVAKGVARDRARAVVTRLGASYAGRYAGERNAPTPPAPGTILAK